MNQNKKTVAKVIGQDEQLLRILRENSVAYIATPYCPEDNSNEYTNLTEYIFYITISNYPLTFLFLGNLKLPPY